MAQEQNQSNQQQNQAQQYAQDKTKQVGQRGGKRVASKAARNSARAARATAQIVRAGVQVGAQAVTAVATSETWAIPAAIIIGVVLIFVIITAILAPILGDGTQTPACDGIEARQTEPIALTALNCIFGNRSIIYRWDSTGNGTFSTPPGQSMTYAPAPTDGEVITITLVVCDASNTSNCSEPYYRDVTLSPSVAGDCNVSPKRVFYCQWGQPYSKRAYDSKTIAATGCGPTSMAMIMSSYCDTHGPAEIAQAFDNNGWSNKPSSGRIGTKHWYYWTGRSTWFRSMGYKYDDDIDLSGTQTVNYNAAKRFLDAGWLLMAGAYWRPIDGGHSFVVDDIRKDSGGNVDVHVRDPNGCSSKYFWVSERVGGSGWYYLYPVKPR